jgi:hypothetical protein
MALFTDADVITLDDLLQFETSLVQVASTHGINVDTKINLAVSGIADRVLLWLLRVGASDPQWMWRRVLGLSTVVITPPLSKWICFDALSRFFAEAYNVQLNTRFQGKWVEYQQQAVNAADVAFASGIGIVYTPLPKPAMPLLSVQIGLGPAQSMYAQTSWADMRGDESALSPVNGLILPGESSVAVAMAEGPLNAPIGAVGWNVYLSTSGTDLTKQNDQPLAICSTWQMPSAGMIQGLAPVDGQLPDYTIQLSRQLQRG